MRRWMIGLVGGLALASATAAAAQAQEGSEGAGAFVRAVFAGYVDGEDPTGPLADDRLNQVWSPRMANLIRRDRELSEGDPPYLDADPLCQCQDWGGLTVESVRIGRWNGPGRTATVAFTNLGERDTTVVRLSGNPNAGWRIDDVLNPGYPSLAEQLTVSNRRREAGLPALGRD